MWVWNNSASILALLDFMVAFNISNQISTILLDQLRRLSGHYFVEVLLLVSGLIPGSVDGKIVVYL